MPGVALARVPRFRKKQSFFKSWSPATAGLLIRNKHSEIMINIIKVWAVELSLAISAVGMCLALVLQHVFGMPPCPYCVVQRMVLTVLMFTCMAGMIWKTRLAMLTAAAVSAAGIVGAAGHTLKVILPATDATCSPGLGAWLDFLWTAEYMPAIYAPVGDCLKDASNLFFLPLPAYSLMLFTGIFAMLVLSAINAKK